jgi:hypothetical protein
MDFLTYYQSQVVHSKNTYYKLADAELQVIHVHHVISLKPTAHEDFSATAVQAAYTLGQL